MQGTPVHPRGTESICLEARFDDVLWVGGHPRQHSSHTAPKENSTCTFTQIPGQESPLVPAIDP